VVQAVVVQAVVVQAVVVQAVVVQAVVVQAVVVQAGQGGKREVTLCCGVLGKNVRQILGELGLDTPS
jgi:hypothetical protein